MEITSQLLAQFGRTHEPYVVQGRPISDLIPDFLEVSFMHRGVWEPLTGLAIYHPDFGLTLVDILRHLVEQGAQVRFKPSL